MKKIETNYPPGKTRPERFHIQEKLSEHMDPFQGGIKAYPEKHGKSETEHGLEKDMGMKVVVETLENKRNNLPYTSLGDKPYKFCDETANFYRDGGLIPGATNPGKMKFKSSGNAKIVDYYANLDLTKPVPTKGLKWADKLKLEALEEDKKAVDGLIKW